MRPVNLIPPEERRGDHAPSRTGALAYIVVGVVAVVLLGVVGVVLTNNQISDQKAHVAELQGQLDQATAEANRLKPYADFAAVESARRQTVTSLAQSRFDWYRVLRELALVIPKNVWLTEVKGGVTPDAITSTSSNSSSASGGAADVSSGITGPSLSISGCASGHDAVAEFLGALRDIDGVTRVVVTQSERSQPGQAPSSGGPSDCAVRNFIAQFQVVAAFDAVQVDPTTGLPTPPVTSTPAQAATGVTGATGATGATGPSGVPASASASATPTKRSQSTAQASPKTHRTSAIVAGTVHP